MSSGEDVSILMGETDMKSERETEIKESSLETFEIHLSSYNIPSDNKRELVNKLSTLTARIHDDTVNPSETRERVLKVFKEGYDKIQVYQSEYNPKGTENSDYIPEESVCWFATKYTEQRLVDSLEESTAWNSIKLLIRRKIHNWESKWEERSSEEVIEDAEKIVKDIAEEKRKSDDEFDEEAVWDEYERTVRERYKNLLDNKKHMKHHLMQEVKRNTSVTKTEIEPEYERIHQKLKEQGASKLAENHRELAEERIEINEDDETNGILERFKSFIRDLTLESLKQFFVKGAWKGLKFAVENPAEVAKIIVILPVIVL